MVRVGGEIISVVVGRFFQSMAARSMSARGMVVRGMAVRGISARRQAVVLALACMLVLGLMAGTGCFSERSFPMLPEQGLRLDAEGIAGAKAGEPVTVRSWLHGAHAQLRELLPEGEPSALLTEDMVDVSGQPVDVFAHFGLRRDRLQSIFSNYAGIKATAQIVSRGYQIDEPAPPWPGFKDVWIPVGDLMLSGRLGYASRGGVVREADAIVLLPGFFGDNGVNRTRDLAEFLRAVGYHVLALEIRGHGQTEAKFPSKCYSFGILETDELMRVSDWLMNKPHVTRTGLVGFCWSANMALLAAWYDGRAADDSSIGEALANVLKSKPTGQRFRAGILAFSPTLRWENMVDVLDTDRSSFDEPVYASLQGTVRTRMRMKHYPNPSGNLRSLIAYECQACGPPLSRLPKEGYTFLRLMPYRDEPCDAKLERANTAVLVVHGANDPLAPAQDVADFVARIANPQVAALIIPGGGHVGFAAYAKAYYFSLIANFFDPEVGAAAQSELGLAISPPDLGIGSGD